VRELKTGTAAQIDDYTIWQLHSVKSTQWDS